MRTLYIACDGKEFENLNECKEYENNLKLKKSSLIMLDCNYKKLNFNEYKNLDRLLERCYYIKIGSNDDLELLKHSSLYVLDEIGEYYYDDNANWWESIDYEIDILERKLKEFKYVKERLN